MKTRTVYGSPTLIKYTITYLVELPNLLLLHSIITNMNAMHAKMSSCKKGPISTGLGKSHFSFNLLFRNSYVSKIWTRNNNKTFDLTSVSRKNVRIFILVITFVILTIVSLQEQIQSGRGGSRQSYDY